MRQHPLTKKIMEKYLFPLFIMLDLVIYKEIMIFTNSIGTRQCSRLVVNFLLLLFPVEMYLKLKYLLWSEDCYKCYC